MFTKRITQLAFLATLGLGTMACEQQDVAPSRQRVSVAGLTTGLEEAESHEDLARVVASALATSAEARVLLHKLALEQFDGDYDVLYRDIAKHEVAGSGTFANLLATQYVKLLERRGQSIYQDEAAQWVEKQTSSIPWCQLAVPDLCADWKAEEVAPKVVALPTSFDDQTTETLLSYQGEDLQEATLVVKEELTEPVVVIGPSERVNAEGQPKYSAEEVVAMRGRYDLLKRYQIADLPNIEPGILGKPELRMVTYKIIPPCYTCSPMVPPFADQIHNMSWSPDRNTVKNQRWHDINSFLYAWGQNSNTLGDRHRDLWFEEDPGPNIQLNLEITFPKGFKVKLNPQISSNDEQMGSSDIFLWDDVWPNAQYAYSTGSVSWYRSN